MVPLLAALLVSGAAPPAPPPRWAVVDVEAPDSMLGLAGQVTRVVLAEAASQKLAVLGPEELRALLKPREFEALRKCAGQPACVAQALEGQKVERVVMGQLGRDEKNYLLKLWLIDVPAMKVVADVDRAILIAARRFQSDLAEAIPRLLRGEAEARGTLVLDSNLTDAQVSVNGELRGTPPLTLSLKPGKYEVKLERRKYLAVTRLITVDADRETREKISLLLKPGEVPDLPPVAAQARKGEAGGGGFRIGAATWILGGLTLVGAGGALYFGLTEQAQVKALQDGYTAATDRYAGTRAQALAARQSALFTNIAFGVGGAALAGFIVSLIVDATRPPEVALSPWLEAGGGGGLVLGGRF